jgi:hypothetical protein
VLPANVGFTLDYTSSATQLVIHMVTPTPQSWTSPAASGTWSVGTNWSTASAPGTSGNVSVISTSSTIAQNVTVATSTTVQQVTVQGTTMPMNLQILQGVQLGVTYQVLIGPHGTLSGGGTVLGNVAVGGGIVAPATGPTAATLKVTGNLTETSQSDIQLDLSSPLAGGFDAISVGGNLAMAGKLDVAAVGPFNPPLGSQYDLLDFASSTGQFAQLNLPPLTGGLAWDTSALTSTGVIRVVQVPEPSSLLLLAAAALAARRRTRRPV